ncbi:hypothetical protein SAMN05660865_00216 [Caloramator fervidus]|uniref:BclA C-terminal domain-containing protein n=1 Tax=Caloramator fervidus TaxID=29344 RepID=A0A1H5RU97_9CLOT|nr:hypothetical protein [Caloramator fervidus]SEF41895.1 hypothetical protein SAMN05660865_00216 [Caloramator fervidus]
MTCNNYINWCLKWLCEEEQWKNFCDFGYIYRIEKDDYETFPQNSFISFEGAITKGGIIFDPLVPTDIIIKNPGIYEVIFYLNCNSQSIVALKIDSQNISFQNTYKNNAASQAIYGHSILEILNQNTILRIIVLNFTGLKLEKTQGNEPKSTNASIIIKRIC